VSDLANDLQSIRKPLSAADTAHPTLDELWAWLADVPDPEIPVVSVVDLGIVRDVAWNEDAETAIITVTPTYSGCPATEVIAQQIREELLKRGVKRVELRVQISPAWTTEWLTTAAKEKLHEYGIAPPADQVSSTRDAMGESLTTLGEGARKPELACPRCGSMKNEMISRFGSTPCKSLHRCLDCREPFDHFKCH